MAETAAGAGVDVTLLTSHDALDMYEVEATKLELRTLVGLRAAGTIRVYAVRSWQTGRVVWTAPRPVRGAGTMVAASFYPPDLVALLVARLRGWKVVLSWQLPIPNPWHESYGGDRFVLASLLRRPTACAAFGRQLLSFLAQEAALGLVGRLGGAVLAPAGAVLSPRHRQIRLVHHEYSPDPPAASSDRTRQTRDIDCVFVGRLHPQKGIPDLVQVWRRVRSPGRRLVVIGAGSASETALLRALAAEDASVELLGSVTGAPKWDILGRARVLLFPSHHESFGLVPDEALACGTPVVAYALPCLNRLAGHAALVPLGDAAAMASAAMIYLENDRTWEAAHDEALRYAARRSWPDALYAAIELLTTPWA